MTFHNSRYFLEKVIGGVLHGAKDYSSGVFQIPDASCYEIAWTGLPAHLC